MNFRDHKINAPGQYYHVFNRGNAKQIIFPNPEDYKFFILRLKLNLYPLDNDENSVRIQKLPPNSFSLVSYCLMPNHYHLLIRQNGDTPTSKLITKVCTSYSKYFNKKYGRIGHVFQDKFKQVTITENNYLNWLSCYIHQNPKVARLVSNLEDYQWSSYNYYINGEGDLPCDKEPILCQFKNTQDYKCFVNESYDLIRENKMVEDIFID